MNSSYKDQMIEVTEKFVVLTTIFGPHKQHRKVMIKLNAL